MLTRWGAHEGTYHMFASHKKDGKLVYLTGCSLTIPIPYGHIDVALYSSPKNGDHYITGTMDIVCPECVAKLEEIKSAMRFIK